MITIAFYWWYIPVFFALAFFFFLYKAANSDSWDQIIYVPAILICIVSILVSIGVRYLVTFTNGEPKCPTSQVISKP